MDCGVCGGRHQSPFVSFGHEHKGDFQLSGIPEPLLLRKIRKGTPWLFAYRIQKKERHKGGSFAAGKSGQRKHKVADGNESPSEL